MLNKAYVNAYVLSFTLHETEVRPKNSDSDFSFVVSFTSGPSAAILVNVW